MVLPILEEMASMGYFGNAGFNAMIYDENILHPIVEINARKTMGWVAFKLQEKHYPGVAIEVAYTKSEKSGILPQGLGKVKFNRQLQISRVA